MMVEAVEVAEERGGRSPMFPLEKTVETDEDESVLEAFAENGKGTPLTKVRRGNCSRGGEGKLGVSSPDPTLGNGNVDEKGAGLGGINTKGREGGVSFLPSFKLASTRGFFSGEKAFMDAVSCAVLARTSRGSGSLDWSCNQLATSLPHDERISPSSSPRRVEEATAEGATAGIGIIALLRENSSAMGRGMGGTGGMVSLSTVLSEEVRSAFFLLEIRKNDRRDLAMDRLAGDDGVE
jgi:hypothetical protein